MSDDKCTVEVAPGATVLTKGRRLTEGQRLDVPIGLVAGMIRAGFIVPARDKGAA